MLTAAAGATAVGFSAPLAYLLWRALSQPGPIVNRWLAAETAGALGRSLLLATTVTLATVVLGTALAWIVARTDTPGRRVWELLLPLPLVVPSFIGAFALLAAFAPGGLLDRALAGLGLPGPGELRGFPGAFAVLTLFTYPYVFLPVVARLRQLPASHEESARLLGRSSMATFFTVVLPQTRGAVLAGGLLVFLYTISDFGAVQLLRYDTLTRTIYAARVFDRTGALAASLLLGLLAVAVVGLERRASRSSRAATPASGARHLTLALGRWRPVVLALLIGVLGLALLGPVATLGYWALRGVGDGGGTELAGLVVPATATVIVSVLAALSATFAVLPVAYLTVRHRSRLSGTVNAVVVGGFALPGLVIALAMVFFTLRAPSALAALYQTVPLLIVAYVVHFGAQALRAAQVAVAGVPPRVHDAARMLGAGRLRRLLAVDLPLALPGLLAGAGLVLLSTMKELPATLLLSPLGFETLATRIWTSAEEAFWADASVAALVLLALSALLTWLLVIRRADALE